MDNKIMEFFNKHFGGVRVVMVDNKPYFVGIDITKALGYANGRKALTTHCKKPIKVEVDVASQNGTSHKARKTQEMICVCKSDIYRLIVRSKLESADEFEKWIFEEVLPSIEMTGGYIPVAKEDSDEVIMAKALKIAESTIQQKDEIIAQLSEKADAFDQLMETKGYMPINRMAKELGIGEYKLFAFLREKKVMFYDKDKINVPYERFRKEGKFVVKETPCQDGEIRSVTYGTKQGLAYVQKLLKKNGYYNTCTN